MKDKTKDAILEVLYKVEGNDTLVENALAKICAIVDEERKDEVVLFEFKDRAVHEVHVSGYKCPITIHGPSEIVFRARGE